MRVSILLSLFILSSCSMHKVVTKEVLVYPNLPKFTAPSPIPIDYPQLDYPRGDKLVVKNTRECKDITDRDDIFWEKCGILDVDYDSNIYMGFDKQNFEKFNHLLINVKARENSWNTLLEVINEQIRVWNEQGIRVKKKDS